MERSFCLVPVMDPISVVLLSLAIFLSLVGWAVHTKLAPAIAIVEKTNVPSASCLTTLPIVGDALYFLNVKDSRGWWIRMNSLFDNCDQAAIKLWLGPKLIIMIRDANIIEALSRSSKANLKDPFVYDVNHIFTRGVVVTSGKTQVYLRSHVNRLVAPAFLRGKYLETFSDKSERFCEKLREFVDNGEFDFIKQLNYYYIDGTLENFMGVPGTQMIKDTYNLPVLMSQMLSVVILRTMMIQNRFDWYFSLTPSSKKVKPIVEAFKSVANDIMQQRRKALERDGLHPEDPDFTPEYYTDAIMQYGFKNNIPKDELHFIMNDFITAGFDTTSPATAATVVFLAIYQDYQEKVYREQVEIMGDSLDPPNAGQLSEMKFLEMAFFEGLRHVSPPFLPKLLTDRFEIDGLIFPKGACVVYQTYRLHTNPKYWERPNEFYPEHFSSENTARRPKTAFLPFSIGTRNCPGRMYAQLATKVVLSMLFRRFKFTTDIKFEDIQFKLATMLQFENGYPVKITKRTKSV